MLASPLQTNLALLGVGQGEVIENRRGQHPFDSKLCDLGAMALVVPVLAPGWLRCVHACLKGLCDRSPLPSLVLAKGRLRLTRSAVVNPPIYAFISNFRS